MQPQADHPTAAKHLELASQAQAQHSSPGAALKGGGHTGDKEYLLRAHWERAKGGAGGGGGSLLVSLKGQG